jgi:predicted nuclease of restriction endonuclease-like (RecB) superfamily
MKYDQLIQAIVGIHERARVGAAVTVNQFLVLRNWMIGAYLIEFEQHGEDRAAYGERLLERIAADLAARRLRGLGVSMLKSSRQFYRLYPEIGQSMIGDLAGSPLGLIRQSVIGELISPAGSIPVAKRSSPAQPTPLSPTSLRAFSWTHFLEFIRLADPWKRAFYENECLNGHWSIRQLQRQIGSLLYERTGLSTNKKKVIQRARDQAVETPLEIAELIRDPYVLEFVGLAEKADFKETELEAALLNHLQSFLLELGAGFCFEARQMRITMDNEHDYVDLVFYHRILRFHLLLDLKVRPFRHGDAGQMNFYLNYFKTRVLQPGDHPPVGIILCSDHSHTKVEFATAGMDNKLFVSRYLVALPKPEQLQALVEADRARFERAHAKNGTGKRSPRLARNTGRRK